MGTGKRPVYAVVTDVLERIPDRGIEVKPSCHHHVGYPWVVGTRDFAVPEALASSYLVIEGLFEKAAEAEGWRNARCPEPDGATVVELRARSSDSCCGHAVQLDGNRSVNGYSPADVRAVLDRTTKAELWLPDPRREQFVSREEICRAPAKFSQPDGSGLTRPRTPLA